MAHMFASDDFVEFHQKPKGVITGVAYQTGPLNDARFGSTRSTVVQAPKVIVSDTVDTLFCLMNLSTTFDYDNPVQMDFWILGPGRGARGPRVGRGAGVHLPPRELHRGAGARRGARRLPRGRAAAACSSATRRTAPLVPLSLTRNRRSGAIACDHTLPPIFYLTTWGGEARMQGERPPRGGVLLGVARSRRAADVHGRPGDGMSARQGATSSPASASARRAPASRRARRTSTTSSRTTGCTAGSTSRTSTRRSGRRSTHPATAHIRVHGARRARWSARPSARCRASAARSSRRASCSPSSARTSARARSPSTSSRSDEVRKRFERAAQARGRRDQHAVLDGVLRRRRELHVRPLDREARRRDLRDDEAGRLAGEPRHGLGRARGLAVLAPARVRGAHRAPGGGDQPPPHARARPTVGVYTPRRPAGGGAERSTSPRGSSIASASRATTWTRGSIGSGVLVSCASGSIRCSPGTASRTS